jgi:hypothetical protein
MTAMPKSILLLVIAATLAVPAGAAQAPQPAPIFRFDTDEMWLNLHHYLYVLGRARAKMPDASREAVAGAPADQARGLERLTDAERSVWEEAVVFYAGGPSRRDLIFDAPLPDITLRLADADDAPNLSDTGIDRLNTTPLERAAPIYRKAWWPDHQAANRARAAEIQALVDRYGRQVLQRITKVYGMRWPADGYPVHVSAFTNWAGAYSTTGNLLVMSSLDAQLRGAHGLETAFHEGMHVWDNAVMTLLRNEARRTNKRLPPNLSHAMIFYTAGDAVRRIIPGHVPYADAFGVWNRGYATFKTPLQETWKPFLDGNGTRDEAIAALVARVGLPIQGDD